jgi:hypothetical protein
MENSISNALVKGLFNFPIYYRQSLYWNDYCFIFVEQAPPFEPAITGPVMGNLGKSGISFCDGKPAEARGCNLPLAL